MSEKIEISKHALMEAVFNGIRKTINRFREWPFLYFTESDIHASLSRDIIEGNSDLFILGKEQNNRSNIKIPVSLIHHEYPTNFRYQDSKLRAKGYSKDEIKSLTILDSTHGDRGNYDLVILNNTFIETIFSQHQDIMEAMRHIINKDIKLTRQRNTNEEILFVIEIKFIHPFNSGNIQMETEVKKDLQKLYVALQSSNQFIMPIALIFCSSDYIQSSNNSIIENIKRYLIAETPQGVCSIFIESYISGNTKKTIKPIFTFSPISPDRNWATKLKLKI